MSWLHEMDFVRIVDWAIHNPEVSGTYNAAAPNPVTNAVFLRALRIAIKIPFGLPLPTIVLEMGAVLIRTETELVLKSRWVIPKRLLASGFEFHFDNIESTLQHLSQPTIGPKAINQEFYIK